MSGEPNEICIMTAMLYGKRNDFNLHLELSQTTHHPRHRHRHRHRHCHRPLHFITLAHHQFIIVPLGTFFTRQKPESTHLDTVFRPTSATHSTVYY